MFDDSPIPEKVNIRIQNLSEYDFEQVYVDTGGGENHFGDLGSGQSSPYAEFGSAFRYAFVQLRIMEDSLTLQPTDFVGEELLEKGFYTYQLDIPFYESPNGSLSLRLRRD